MEFSLTQDQQEIRDAVLKLCARFGDDYWLERDRDGVFPTEFHRAMAEAGWLGVAMPEAVGGAGLGITEAAIMMQAVAESGGGMTAASSIHGPVFSMQPVELFGTEAQKQRMIPPVLSGEDRICFAVTEPNTGLDTTKLKTRAERCDGGYRVNGEKIWISVAQVANKMMLLARTTPLEEVKRKTDGLSLFFTDLDRSKIEVRVIHKMGRHAVDSLPFLRSSTLHLPLLPLLHPYFAVSSSPFPLFSLLFSLYSFLFLPFFNPPSLPSSILCFFSSLTSNLLSSFLPFLLSSSFSLSSLLHFLSYSTLPSSYLPLFPPFPSSFLSFPLSISPSSSPFPPFFKYPPFLSSLSFILPFLSSLTSTLLLFLPSSALLPKPNKRQQ